MNSGRNRFPPAWNRCWTASAMSSSALPSSSDISCSILAHAVPDVGGERRVPEINACHHSRWCPHSSNILGSMDAPAGRSAATRDIHRQTWSSSARDRPGRRLPHGRLAAGRDVLVVDAAQFPRDKSCGDGLTPRAVAELERLGMGPWLDTRIRHHGLRMSGFGADVEVRWPGPSFPSTGALSRAPNSTTGSARSPPTTAPRCDWEPKPLGSTTIRAGGSNRCCSTTAPRCGCDHLIVADGARSTLGRVLGREWHKETVYGTAIRGYIATPRSRRAVDHLTSGAALPRRPGAARLRPDLPRWATAR